MEIGSVYDANTVIDKSLAEKLPLASVCRVLDLTYGQYAKEGAKRARDVADYDTMYGTVMKTATMDVRGKSITIDHVDIRAFFLMMTKKC